MPPTIHRCLSILTSVGLAACSALPDIDRTEPGRLYPTLRVSVPLGTAKPERPFRVRGNASLSATKGSFWQSGLGDVDYGWVEGSLAARFEWRFAQGYVAPMAGLAWNKLDVDVIGPGSAASRNHDCVGPLAGLELGWLPFERVTLYVRGSASALLFDTYSRQAEVGVALRLTDGLGLLAGYRYWRLENDDWLNDFDLRTHGAVAGFDLDF